MQDLLEKTNAMDASGNIVLGDIGVYIQQEVGSILLLFLAFFFFSSQLNLQYIPQPPNSTHASLNFFLSSMRHELGLIVIQDFKLYTCIYVLNFEEHIEDLILSIYFAKQN